ncbi:MAG TPA: chemotaxis protein CheB [Bryobacteraceae bacterium]
MKTDIVVVGASSGGVDALQQFAHGLPADLPAAVFVVLHMLPWISSSLPEILSAAGPLPAGHPQSGQRFEPGRIYVAPPDRHLLLEDDRVMLWRGPKENRHRPAVNALFRSAAVAHRGRVAGVVLTGALDDGSTGLWWVKRFGGVAIVQDPEEARCPEMPQSALEHVNVDYVERVARMGRLLSRLTNGAGLTSMKQDKE